MVLVSKHALVLRTLKHIKSRKQHTQTVHRCQSVPNHQNNNQLQTSEEQNRKHKKWDLPQTVTLLQLGEAETGEMRI